MTNRYTSAQKLSILAGVAAAGGALYILLADLLEGHALTVAHALMPIAVGITIISGHLIGAAFRERKLVSAAGFLLLFVAGTALTVYASVGRQSSAAETKANEASASNALVQAKQGDLQRARERLAMANTMADKERGTSCGKKCQDWQLRAREVGSDIQRLEGELRQLGAVKPVAANASKMAELLALFGADHAKVKQACILLEPFAWSLFLELASIFAFGFGFGHRSAKIGANDNVVAAPAPVAHNVIDWVRAHRDRHGRLPQIPEVQAAFPGLPKTTAWRRIKAV